jgi:glycerol kinase
MKVVLALDQGTTSSRAIVFDAGAACARSPSRNSGSIFPQPGWVEHDRRDLARPAGGGARRAAAGRPGRGDIAALGITNQRETTVLWDRATGRPLAPRHRLAGPAHRRPCAALRRRGHDRWIGAAPGWCSTLFLGHQAGLAARPRARARAGAPARRAGLRHRRQLAGLEPDRRGRLHVTDASTPRARCSSTSTAGDWDDELLALFGIPRERAAAVVRLQRGVGETAPALFGAGRCPLRHGRRPAGGPVRPGLPRPGMAKNTYGTGCFLLHQHRRAAGRLAATACSPPWPGAGGRTATRWRAASSSAARWCSGCATASA